MADQKVDRFGLSGDMVRAKTSDILGVNLSSLREIVRLAEGMEDKAIVTFLGLDQSVDRAGEYYAREVVVRDERWER